MNKLAITVVILLTASVLCAQTEPPAEAPASGEPVRSDSGTSGIGVPGGLTANTHDPLTSGASASPTNFMSGGIEFGVVYDDNTISSATRKGVVQYQISPDIGVHRKGKRSEFDIDYYTGVTLSRQAEARDEVLHDLSSKLSYALSRHVDLHLRQAFRHQSTPFTNSFGEESSSSSTNQFVVTPLATRQSLEFGGDLGWRFRPHSLVGMSAEYSRLRFSNVVGDQSLLPVNATDLKAYFGQQLSARHTVGIAATFQYLDSPGTINASTRVTGLQVFDVLKFSNQFSLSMYGGPQSSTTRSPRSTTADERSSKLNFSGGAALHWDSRRINFTLSYEDSINDGGGIAQFVRLRSGEAGTRIRLSKTWDFGLSCGVGDNEVLGAPSEFDRFKTISGTVTVEHQLSSNVRMLARYEHFHQTLGPEQALFLASDRNRFLVKLAYRFNRPLGSLSSER